MGYFKAEPAYPFSGFSGQLLFEGRPASHAKVIRQYELESKRGVHEDAATADKDGHFSFESILIQYKVPMISAFDFLSHQDIVVEYQGEKYNIWGGGKTELKEYTEFSGKPKNLYCELTEKRRRLDVGMGFIGTSCHWEID